MAVSSPPRPAIYSIPNLLTLARLGLAIVLFVLIELHAWIGCVLIFAVAALTDWLDGYLARRWNQGSALGRNLDPLVDKVLVCGAFIFLLPIKEAELGAWMVAVVVGRELLITGLRGYIETKGVNFGADWLGKIKMVLQCAALIAIFVELAASDRVEEKVYLVPLTLVRVCFVWGMLVATILSGLQYLYRAWLVLKAE